MKKDKAPGIDGVTVKEYEEKLEENLKCKGVKKQTRGFAQLIRYADDFIVCFEYEEDAKEFGERLRQRLGKFGLKVSEEKSRIIEFGRKAWQRAKEGGGKVSTFNFLGFTHYCNKTRKGGVKVGRKTSQKKMKVKLKAMNQWLKSSRNAIEFKEWWQVLKQKLIGHYHYYGISGNMKGQCCVGRSLLFESTKCGDFPQEGHIYV